MVTMGNPRVNILAAMANSWDTFDSRIDRSGGDDACWLWLGHKNAGGYGTFGPARAAKLTAHRVALCRKLGRDLGPKMCAIHSCDTPACVNPDHLSEGSRLDNNRDRNDKGRNSCGERHPGAKLTPADIELIRSRPPGKSLRQLARDLGVGKTVVIYIARGRAWKHLLQQPAGVSQ